MPVFALFAFAPATRAAEDAPAAEGRFPPWFREFITTVQTNSARARTAAEGKLAEALRSGDRPTEADAQLAVSTALRIQNDLAAALSHSRQAVVVGEL